MPNNPIRSRGDYRRFVTQPPTNKAVRGIQVGFIIQTSQSPAASSGSASTGGPSQRGSLNPAAGGGGGGMVFPPA